MSNIERAPKVLIVSEPSQLITIDLVRSGAEKAGWRPLPFDDIELAVDEFDTSISALITVIGSNGKLPHRVYGWLPQNRLLDISDDYAIPRAVLSSHPFAKRYIRPNSSDVIIPKSEPADLSPRVAQWLTELYMSIQES